MKFARAFLTLLALALPAVALAAPVELLVFAPSLNRVVGYGVIVNGELKLTVNGYNGRVSGILLGDKPIRVSGTLSNGKLTFVGPKGGFKDVAGILASYGVTAKVSVTRVNTAAVVAGTATTPANTGSGSSAGSGNNAGNGKTSAPGQADKGAEPATPGKSGSAPGQTKDDGATPGKSGAAPTQDTKDDATPGKSTAAPGQDKKEAAEDAPGKSGSAPGQEKTETTPPGKEKAK
jgi:hypothetical protein